jgi:hypothetical protein
LSSNAQHRGGKALEAKLQDHQQPNSHRGEQTALGLLSILVAAAVSWQAAPGYYSTWDIIIGIVILLVGHAFGRSFVGPTAEQRAFCAIYAFGWLNLSGPFFDAIFLRFKFYTEAPYPFLPDQEYRDFMLFGWWVALAVFLYWWRSRRRKLSAAENEPPPEV